MRIEKKVLLIYVEPTPYILGLISNLSRRWPAGVDVLFFSENVSQAWGIELAQDNLAVLPSGFIASLGVIWQRLKTNDYSVMHLAGWSPILMPAAMVVARQQGVIVTVESDTPIPVGTPLWKRSLKRLLYPLLFSLPHMFFPGGKRQAAYMRHYGVNDARIVQANMTVDVAAICRYIDAGDVSGRKKEVRESLGLAQDATVFLYVGRMEPHKGVQDLLAAFSMFPVAARARLLLVGEGSMNDELGRAVAADSRICWTGRLSGAALLSAYASADVFVLVSRFEPWGLVVNEAMAAGLPVVASDSVGCIDDLVIHGVTGLIVSTASVQALAAALASLHEDIVLREGMGKSGRRLISGWTLENEAEILAKTWNRLLTQ